MPNLRDDDRLVAAPAERLPERALRRAHAVALGGVEAVDAEVERAIRPRARTPPPRCRRSRRRPPSSRSRRPRRRAPSGRTVAVPSSYPSLPRSDVSSPVSAEIRNHEIDRPGGVRPRVLRVGRSDRDVVSDRASAQRGRRCSARVRPTRRTGRTGSGCIALRCVMRSMSSSLTPSRVFGEPLGRERPRRVRVRVVALPHDVVQVEELAVRDAEPVVDEAREHVLVEDLARQPAAEVLAGPGVVAAVAVVDALEEVRDPADAALRQRDLEVRELPEDRRPDEVGRGLDDVDRGERDQAVDRRVRCASR